MARILLCLLLLCGLLGFAQQQPQGQNPPANPPSSSADNNPPPAQDPSQNQEKASANQRIQSSINDLLSSDPVLNGVDVEASVNDESIILTGTVDSYAQHQRVLQLVSTYGQWRKIVDKVKMQ
jgi:osmotically-inducible protein OsmY